MRLGAHVSVAGGKYKAIERGAKIKCEALQIFIRNVRAWTSKPLEEQDIKDFLEFKTKHKEIWPILSHNSYLINLAGTDEEKLNKSFNAMLDELTKAEQLKLDYINMHPGNKNEDEKEEDALLRIASQLNKLFDETNNSKVKIVLETTAGQGNDVGYSFEHMAKIIENIENKNRIGITFDTCHSFAAGYDFTTQDKYDQLWNNFEEIVGLEYLYAFHLNDAANELGSRVDRHEHIGQGEIGLKVFSFFVNDEKFSEHPGILETPDGIEKYEENLRKLKNLRK
ncbi:MAG: putative endonuclease 4 [Promethearchaeota archaeon]|nr:MAG: putative endonuclease 4 [Candidatus Lokiarchaeota archaeon]